MHVVEIPTPRPFKEGVNVVIGDDSAYIDIYEYTTPKHIAAAEAELAEAGWELMELDECPAEVTGDGIGLRLWAVRIDGGAE